MDDTETHTDTELERLELAEHDAHARFLRLEGFGDPKVVRSAQKLWQEAAAALHAHLERVKS